MKVRHLRPGDRVVARVKDGCFVAPYDGTLVGLVGRPGNGEGPLAWVLADAMFVEEMRASYIVSRTPADDG